jgi:hypothetical protein
MPSPTGYEPFPVGVNRWHTLHLCQVGDETGIPGDLVQTVGRPNEVEPSSLNAVRKI